jgi:uncharacterized protein YbaR (Trm112 family)
MKLRLMDVLVCPVDRTPLELVEWEAKPVELSAESRERIRSMGHDETSYDREVVTGLLLNRARRVYYPILGGVPRLLTFRTAVAETFATEHRERLAAEYRDFSLPSASAVPGEADVLRTFSSEWLGYDWTGETYWNLTPAALYQAMRFLLDLDRQPARGKLVLEVGIGIGGIADYVSTSEGCELVGVDLSHAVDAAYRNFGRNPLLHIVQASAFAPPFRNETFDLVYSQGVIHHTYSTKAAFDRLSALPRKGARLYVWVYSPYSEQRTPIRRALMVAERLLRPICWRLPESLQTAVLSPLVPLYMLHQRRQARQSEGVVRYGWREGLHAARDRFTPRYAHRHSEEEVTRWFRERGYSQVQVVSKRPAPSGVPEALIACTGVDGKRSA